MSQETLKPRRDFSCDESESDDRHVREGFFLCLSSSSSAAVVSKSSISISIVADTVTLLEYESELCFPTQSETLESCESFSQQSLESTSSTSCNSYFVSATFSWRALVCFFTLFGESGYTSGSSTNSFTPVKGLAIHFSVIEDCVATGDKLLRIKLHCFVGRRKASVFFV